MNDFKQKESNYNSQINLLNIEIEHITGDLKNNEIKYEKQIKNKDNQILSLKNDFNQQENKLNNKINNYAKKIKQKDNQIKVQQSELSTKKNKIQSIEQAYIKQLSKIDNSKYCISCYKEEILNNSLEIKYLKCNSIIKKILSSMDYLYLLLKSNPKEISLNIKLYRLLKKSKCFDIGFYLNKNNDLIESKWYKYLSLELHYVCNGFSENRVFNKKYFNRNSKKELLQYLLNCDE